MSKLYIIGYRGTGKTTVSGILARKLKKKVIHMDSEIEKKTGKIENFVNEKGWPSFRKIETKLLEEISQKEDLIVDCGGGIILADENIALMKKAGRVIWLKASVKTIRERLVKDRKKRPSLTEKKDSVNEIEEVLAQRIKKYERASDFSVETEKKTAERIAEEIIDIIKLKICVPVTENDSDAFIRQMSSIKEADLIELRIDYLKDIDEKILEKIIHSKQGKVIVTCRPKNLGGNFSGNEKERIRLLKKAIDFGSEYIDIEIETGDDTLKEIIKNKKNTKIIISHHDFQKTPGLMELEKIYQKINSFKPDIVKIATTAVSINDCFTIFNLLKRKNNLAALSMGIKGQLTRILSGKFGSVIVYASMKDGKESAPGQLTLKELKEEYNLDEINKETKLLGVIGEFAENSKSRFMHNANFKKKKLNCIYVPLKVSPDELKEFMKNFRNFGFIGAAVTVPHKETIVKYIDGLDETAKAIGATNTLVSKSGKLTGYNTDYFGAVEALKEKTGLNNKKVLLIGAGGAARAIIYGLKKEKANSTVINRTKEKAKELAREFNVGFSDIKNIDIETEKNDIIINTTSVGMNPRPDECILKYLPKNKIVMDIVYSPIETKLIKLARKNKCITITGERMLIHQAIGQFEKWTGIKPKFKDMEKALLDHISQKHTGGK